MKNNWSVLLTISSGLTIIFAIIFLIALISCNSMPYNNPSFETAYYLMWVGLGGTPLFAILWFLSKIKVEDVRMEENRIKSEEQRKIESEKKKQKKAETAKAFAEISDIWEYGEKAMIAVAPHQSGKSEIGGIIYYVKLKNTNSNSTPWIITIYTPDGLSEDFKAKRKDNTLVGLKNDKVVVMTKEQLTINGKILFFSAKNEYVTTISGLMKELLNGKKNETVRLEHLKVAGEDAIDTLPKFHISLTKDGLKCDEINYPQKHLEDFFQKSNGKEHVFQNKVFYMDYCRNKGLYDFSVFEERDFLQYMREMHMQAIKSGYSCYTDFQLSEWQVSIRHGVEKLFKSFKSYVDKKTLDVVPFAFEGNAIYLQHKHYPPKNNETMLFHNLAIALMEEERKDIRPSYFISKTDDGKILINIDGDAFLSVKK